MKKFRYDDCICRTKLVDHSLIKDRILNEIKLSTHYENIDHGEYYSDKVSRADMDLCGDPNRSWYMFIFAAMSSKETTSPESKIKSSVFILKSFTFVNEVSDILTRYKFLKGRDDIL